MPRKSKQPDPAKEPSGDDASLFRQVVGETKPLKLDVVAPPRPRRPAKARFSRQDERQVLAESLRADLELAESNNGDGLRYRHPSVGLKTMRRLARGRFSVQAEIDLHGMTTAEAKTVLQDFIHSCLGRGCTCVRIVHGKGLRSGHKGPVLKQKVDLWLRRSEGILAFVSARQVDGGTGAVYVLLKKKP